MGKEGRVPFPLLSCHFPFCFLSPHSSDIQHPLYICLTLWHFLERLGDTREVGIYLPHFKITHGLFVFLLMCSLLYGA